MNYRIKALLILSIILSSWIQKGLAQKYYPDLISHGDKMYSDSNYKEAIKFYEQAFAVNNHAHLRDKYYYACCQNLSGNTEKAFKILNQITKKGFKDISIKEDSDLKSLHNDSRWAVLIKQIENNKINIEAGYDKSLMNILSKVYETDQKFRVSLDSLYRSDNPTIDLKVSISNSIEKYDSLNIILVSNIIEENGWPGINKVGNEGNLTVFMIIQHASTPFQKKYYPYLLKSISLKQTPKRFKAYLIDRMLVREGKKQIYGTQTTFNSLSKKYELLPVKSKRKLDKLRGEIGLESVTNYLNYMNGE